MHPPIVAYHSKTGTTGAVAARIAASLGCGTDAIVATDHVPGLAGILSAGFGLVTGKHGPVQVAHDPATHDPVIVGTPVWAGKCAGPVVEYLRARKASLARVAFFATSGMTGAGTAFADMERACGKAPVATLHVLAGEVVTGLATPKIEAFTARIKEAIGPR